MIACWAPRSAPGRGWPGPRAAAAVTVDAPWTGRTHSRSTGSRRPAGPPTCPFRAACGRRRCGNWARPCWRASWCVCCWRWGCWRSGCATKKSAGARPGGGAGHPHRRPRSAHRRRRPRFQQPAHGDPGQCRDFAAAVHGRPPDRAPAVFDPRRHRARRQADAPAAGVRPGRSDGAVAGGSGPQARRPDGGDVATGRFGRGHRDGFRVRPAAGQRRPSATRGGPAQPGGQRPRRHERLGRHAHPAAAVRRVDRAVGARRGVRLRSGGGCRGCSSRSSPPSRWARARVWGFRRSTAWSGARADAWRRPMRRAGAVR